MILFVLAAFATAPALEAPTVRSASAIAPGQLRAACGPDALERANARSLYRPDDPRNRGVRPLDEMPDAHMILTVYKQDARGCPIIEIVQRNVSTRGEAADRPASQPQRRLQRDRQR